MLVISAAHSCHVLIFLWFTRQANKHAMEANVIARENAANMTRIANQTLALSRRQANNTEALLILMIMAVIILFCFTIAELARIDETKKKPEASKPQDLP